MNFLNKEMDINSCKKYIIGIIVFIIIILTISVIELMFPKRFNSNLEAIQSEEYAVNIEDISSSKFKLSISGFAFKGEDAIGIFNSYYILKNKETGKMYKLKTKMEQRGNFIGTGVEFSGMHSQTITAFMDKGSYELYIWYDNNNENKLLKTGKEVNI